MCGQWVEWISQQAPKVLSKKNCYGALGKVNVYHMGERSFMCCEIFCREHSSFPLFFLFLFHVMVAEWGIGGMLGRLPLIRVCFFLVFVELHQLKSFDAFFRIVDERDLFKVLSPLIMFNSSSVIPRSRGKWATQSSVCTVGWVYCALFFPCLVAAFWIFIAFLEISLAEGFVDERASWQPRGVGRQTWEPFILFSLLLL